MITTALRIAGVTAGTALAATAALVAPAHAVGSGHDAKVISSTGVVVRYAPSTHTASVGTVGAGQTIPIECKVHGTSVGGNDIWYLLPPDTHEWVSAKYVRAIGAEPGWCGTTATAKGRTTAGVNTRSGPTAADAKNGSYARGATVSIRCKVDGQSVAGNTRWYYTTSGRWLAAKYVDNIGRAPGWCTS